VFEFASTKESMTTSFTRCGINKPCLPAHTAADRLTAYTYNDPGRLASLSWNGQTISEFASG